jgi:hypothetical protein
LKYTILPDAVDLVQSPEDPYQMVCYWACKICASIYTITQQYFQIWIWYTDMLKIILIIARRGVPC